MKAYNMIEDTANKMGVHFYEVFEAAFLANAQPGDVGHEACALDAFHHWKGNNEVPAIVWNFCVSILTDKITPMSWKQSAKPSH